MMVSDERLLDLDDRRPARFDRGEAQRMLAGEHGDVYRNHLVISHWIDRWIEGLDAGHAFFLEDGYHKGFVQALHEVAAHLRQGDFRPGGRIYEDTGRAL